MGIQSHLVKQINAERDKKYHVLFVPTLSSAIAFYRMEQFVLELRKNPEFSVAYTYHNPSYTDTCRWEWQLAQNPELIKEFEKLCECADLVIFQALHSRGSAALLRAIKDKYKIPVLSDFDDDPYSLPASHPSYDVISPGSSAEAYSDDQIRQSDGLIVTNTYLKKVFIEKNKKIFVIPNSLNFNVWDNLKRPKKDGLIRIGYTGGSNHKEDLEIILDPLKYILKKHSNVRFVLYYGGEIPTEFRIKGVIQRDFRHWAPINEYPQKLASMNFDIGLTPLRDRRFNRCKSNLKYMEYSALKIPTISSPVEPYRYSRAMFAKNESEWVERIESLIKNAELRGQLGEAAYKDVFSHFNISETAKDYEKVIKGVIRERVS